MGGGDQEYSLVLSAVRTITTSSLYVWCFKKKRSVISTWINRQLLNGDSLQTLCQQFVFIDSKWKTHDAIYDGLQWSFVLGLLTCRKGVCLSHWWMVNDGWTPAPRRPWKKSEIWCIYLLAHKHCCSHRGQVNTCRNRCRLWDNSISVGGHCWQNHHQYIKLLTGLFKLALYVGQNLKKERSCDSFKTFIWIFTSQTV